MKQHYERFSQNTIQKIFLTLTSLVCSINACQTKHHFKGQKCSGGKNSKVRLTGMAAGNAIGEKLLMFVIGKSKTPRCFKHIKNLPCKYKSQKKSWMDSQMFEEWVRKLDRTFRMEERKIALLICTSICFRSNKRSASFLTVQLVYNRWIKV